MATLRTSPQPNERKGTPMINHHAYTNLSERFAAPVNEYLQETAADPRTAAILLGWMFTEMLANLPTPVAQETAEFMLSQLTDFLPNKSAANCH